MSSCSEIILCILQDYLREQPDNMKSFNIVAETAQFINLVYSNINQQNIPLVTQLFETLNEFTVVSTTCPCWQMALHSTASYYLCHLGRVIRATGQSCSTAKWWTT